MITRASSSVDNPFTFNKDIKNLLLRKIDYSCKVIETEDNKQLITRNANYVNINKPNEFSYIINGCTERVKYIEPNELKYNRLLLEKQENGEDADDENIDQMLAAIKKQIKSYKIEIAEINKMTDILYSSLFLYLKQLTPENQERIKNEISTNVKNMQDPDLINKCNEVLESLKEMDNIKTSEEMTTRLIESRNLQP